MPFCRTRALHTDEVDYCAMEKFYNKVLVVSSYFTSEEFKLELFGDKLASKYEYQPIFRHAEGH